MATLLSLIRLAALAGVSCRGQRLRTPRIYPTERRSSVREVTFACDGPHTPILPRCFMPGIITVAKEERPAGFVTCVALRCDPRHCARPIKEREWRHGEDEWWRKLTPGTG